MRGLEEMKRLKEQFGSYGVTATSEVGGTMAALVAKVAHSRGFSDTERATLLRALDWCCKSANN